MSIKKVKESLSKKYEFIKLIGKGGFAEVYLAKDKILERDVAIKILLPQHAGDTEVIERFIREAKLYAKFDQRNLIPIYETGIVENNAFLVMKYVNGFSLKDIIEKQGALQPDLIIKVVKGMASALTYIHGKGIIHRDIKPANILIENDTNRVFLADFGIARPISSKTLTQTGMLIGTPYYISPEQIKSGIADKRSDIYALGTTLYELISGKPVFKCETPIEILYKHVNEDPKPISSINPNITMEMKHIVEKCLEKDPNNRFQNANEILDLIASGKTTKFGNIYNKKGNRFYKSTIFKLSLIFLFFISVALVLYQFTPILNFLKSQQIENKNEIVKKENEKTKINNKEIKKNEIKSEEIPENETDKISETKQIKNQVKENINKNKSIKQENNVLIMGKTELPKISFVENKYKEFFALSKKYYKKSDFISADKFIKKAKKYKETLELYQLDEKIQDELKKKSETKEEKKTFPKKEPIKRVIKKISLFKLKPELTKLYMAKIDRIRIIVSENKVFFINKVLIEGQLTVKIRINAYGKLSLQEINQENLIITPLISKKRILRGIWLKLKNIRFQRPVDKKGNMVILENWRVTFIVSKFKNKIILRKV